jgi:CheY-like chemotaxis protein
MLQEILEERLSLRNYAVTVVSNGAKAITQVLAEPPDLILMDMRLPVLDGWETTRRLKAMPETSHIPIIALTAHALVGDRESSIAAGCDEYEPKPVNFPQLMQKIADLLT